MKNCQKLLFGSALRLQKFFNSLKCSKHRMKCILIPVSCRLQVILNCYRRVKLIQRLSDMHFELEVEKFCSFRNFFPDFLLSSTLYIIDCCSKVLSSVPCFHTQFRRARKKAREQKSYFMLLFLSRIINIIRQSHINYLQECFIFGYLNFYSKLDCIFLKSVNQTERDKRALKKAFWNT